MPREKYIRASDLGTHAFCARALALNDAGAPCSLVQSQVEGIAHHEAHGQHIRSSVRTRKLSTWLIFAALALLALASLLAR